MPKELLKVEKCCEDMMLVTVAETGRSLGYFHRGVDGEWMYDDDDVCGFWTSYMMRAIADKLDELREESPNNL